MLELWTTHRVRFRISFNQKSDLSQNHYSKDFQESSWGQQAQWEGEQASEISILKFPQITVVISHRVVELNWTGFAGVWNYHAAGISIDRHRVSWQTELGTLLVCCQQPSRSMPPPIATTIITLQRDSDCLTAIAVQPAYYWAGSYRHSDKSPFTDDGEIETELLSQSGWVGICSQPVVKAALFSGCCWKSADWVDRTDLELTLKAGLRYNDDRKSAEHFWAIGVIWGLPVAPETIAKESRN